MEEVLLVNLHVCGVETRDVPHRLEPVYSIVVTRVLSGTEGYHSNAIRHGCHYDMTGNNTLQRLPTTQ